MDITLVWFISALVGTLGYRLFVKFDWTNKFWFLYDVPTVPVASGFAGLWLIIGFGGDWGSAFPILTLFLVVVGLASGAQFRGWPLSGHLAVITFVSALTPWNEVSPNWLLPLAPFSLGLVLWIRTFKPQSPVMAKRLPTVTGILTGCFCALLAVYFLG